MRFLTIVFLLGSLCSAAYLQTPKAGVKTNERAEWEKTAAITDPAERIAALRTFIKRYPRSTHRAEAAEMLVTLGSTLGNEKLQLGDIPAAAAIFVEAANDAPKTIPDAVWALVAKFPANLYFRASRAQALEIAKILESKSASNAGQMLDIATFYLTIENGSEARRLAEKVIALNSGSSPAYQTLGLANRMDFRLEESAAAYAEALELEPESLSAKRGLAEMKRSLGKADDAVVLYREILAKDEANTPARTGLILSLFDAENRTDAEAELAQALVATPNNVILAAGAAYWYASHNEGDKAVELAQKAIAIDARFIWSHIALARGFLSQKKPVEAEKALLAARRYGNFPTLEYEIASARLASGFYREAAEELAKNFTVKDGTISTKLGGRIERSSTNFTELVGYERRASIFAPTAADDPEMAARLTALLELKQELDRTEPRGDVVTKTVDEFVKGTDGMKVHRQIFAASELIEKKTAVAKAVELMNTAAANVDAGVEVPAASSAVLASELYERRSIAAIRDEYLNVPDVPKTVLASVLRGRIDEIGGLAAYQSSNTADAVTRLKRAVATLPADSAWWRSATWLLGTALVAAGNDKDALEMYVKSYRSSGVNVFRYGIIETLYKKVNGNADGLEALIGPNPAAMVAKVEATPTPDVMAEPTPTETPADTATVTPTPTETPAEVAAATPDITPTPSPEPAVTPAFPPGVPVATETPTPEATPVEPVPSPPPTPAEPQPSPTAEPVSTPEATPSATPTPLRGLFEPVVITIPTPDVGKPPIKEPETKTEPSPTETPVIEQPTPSPAETPEAEQPTPSPNPVTEPLATPTPIETPTPTPTPSSPPSDRPRVVEGGGEVTPCKLTVSEETINLQTGGGDLAVVVGLENDGDLEGLTATSTSPDDVSVRRESIAGVRSRALFVVRAVSARTGVYQIRFEMPCGRREIVVNVR